MCFCLCPASNDKENLRVSARVSVGRVAVMTLMAVTVHLTCVDQCSCVSRARRCNDTDG